MYLIVRCIVANHIIASVGALIRWWLDNDMPHSAQRMGQIYARLIMEPARQLARATAISESDAAPE